MANAIFDIYKEAMLGVGNHGGTLIDIDADTIKATLIDTADDDPSATADEDIADIAAAARVATATLASVTGTNGTMDCADLTFSAVSGDQAEELIVWKDSGVEGTSVLMVLYDTFTSGMPVTPNGGDIIWTPNASGLFSL